MTRSTSILTNVGLTLLLITLFASSALASGTGSNVTTTVVVNGTYSTQTPTPKATSTQNPSTPSSLVGGSSTLEPLAQILLLAAAGVFATFAVGL